ncbi:hypothetical protein Agub_g9376 [Astrephomene gubernaculifera]|uniref:Uncharacterized protein n=1 Tax=Astrephomene gubernaculifera TaxID=47775 RepID=A0AAD3DTE7_9CHLO|nr:hypothetical protein Agub_g9376 [Astrephomene gubernaculifera]
MCDLLQGWPECARSSRPVLHVNPLPARKPSKRAKYGEVVLEKVPRQRAPRVVRPRPQRASEYFRQLIRQAQRSHQQRGQSTGAVPLQPGQEEQQQEEQQQEEQQQPPLGLDHQTMQNLGDVGLQNVEGGQARAVPAWEPEPTANGLHELQSQLQSERQHPPHETRPPPQQQQQPQVWASEPGWEWAFGWEQEQEPEREQEHRKGSPEEGHQRRTEAQQEGHQRISSSSSASTSAPSFSPVRYPHSSSSTSAVTAATASAASAATAQAPAAAVAPASSPPAGFPRRRKLFPESPDGPHPHTTARIVARLAACRHWRRPLAHRLLPRYLPLFDQHAAAYFFKHVPSLQPGGAPGSPGRSSPSLRTNLNMTTPTAAATTTATAYALGTAGLAANRTPAQLHMSQHPHPRLHPAHHHQQQQQQQHPEAAGFRLMLRGVCCSLLPKLPSFGPRALTCMVTGLARMGFRHGPTLAAWVARSTSQLGLMRPDQLVDSLEGLAALVAQQRPTAAVAAGAAGGEKAVKKERRRRRKQQQRGGRGAKAAAAAQPSLGPDWRQAAVAAAAAAVPDMSVGQIGRLLQAMVLLQLQPPSSLLDSACTAIRQRVEQTAARLEAAAGGSISSSRSHERPALLVIATMADAEVTAAAEEEVKARNSRVAASPPPPPLSQPLRGSDLALVLAGVAASGHAPRSEWLSWLLESTAAVLKAQLGSGWQQQQEQQQQQRMPERQRRGPAAARRWVAPSRSGTTAEEEEELQPSATEATATAPFFMVEDLAEMVGGIATLLPLLTSTSLLTSPSVQPNEGTGGAGGANGATSLSVLSLPASIPAEWLDLACETALQDLRRRLDPSAAAAAVALVAAASPTAILTQGDVTRAESAAAATTIKTVAAAAAAAAAAAPAATLLLATLTRLHPYYTPPRRWCTAVASVGLDLVPYLAPPSALLDWLEAMATWGAPKPLPPAWSAAVAVSSRFNFLSYTGGQLCRLPAAVLAAGGQLSPSWAAEYLAHLASRLPPTSAVTTAAATAGRQGRGQRRRRGSVRLGRQRLERRIVLIKPGRRRGVVRQEAPIGTRSGLFGGGTWTGGGAGRKSAGPAAAAAAASLREIAAALGCLPLVVSDLRYAADCEELALQALEAAFRPELATAGLMQEQRLEHRASNPPPSPPPPAATTVGTTPAAAAAVTTGQ